MQRSHLLSVSQLRSQTSIELLHKKTLVAAKVWGSHYPVSLIIIHTSLGLTLPCFVNHYPYKLSSRRFQLAIEMTVLPVVPFSSRSASLSRLRADNEALI